MFNNKRLSGYTDKTAEHLLLGSGVFFKNFTPGTDTYESAKTAGKLIGATRGGGEFKATPEWRAIPIDGVPENTKGLQVIDRWTTSLMATVVEQTPASIALAVAAASVNTTEVQGYTSITAKDALALDDYIDNITFVGRISGNEKPVIIQVFNAFNNNGLTIAPTDKGEATTQMIFAGNYEGSDTDAPPFKILYPTQTQVK